MEGWVVTCEVVWASVGRVYAVVDGGLMNWRYVEECGRGFVWWWVRGGKVVGGYAVMASVAWVYVVVYGGVMRWWGICSDGTVKVGGVCMVVIET